MHIKKIKPVFVREDKRGIFCEALNGMKWENVQYGTMKKGAIMGNHYHKKTTVYFFITAGSAKIKTINIKSKKTESFLLKVNEGVLLTPNYSHAITFKENSSFVMGKSIAYNKKEPDTYVFDVPGVPHEKDLLSM